jgi:hypothetical protein
VEFNGAQGALVAWNDMYFGCIPLSGIQAIANVIPDMGALTSLHVGKNNIPAIKMREIMAITMRMESMKILCEVPFKDKTLTELDISGKNVGMEGALVVAEYLDGNGAMTKVDISKNSIFAAGTKLLAEALKGNQSITKLDISSNNATWDGQKHEEMSGVIALANSIRANGALLVLSLKDNALGTKAGGKVIGEMLKANSVLQELDLSSNGVYPEEGNGPKFAIALSQGLADNGTLSKLSLADNFLAAKTNAKGTGEALAEMLKGNSVLKELDVSANAPDGYHVDGPAFAVGISQGLSDNGAISSINLLKNQIPVKQAQELVKIMQAKENLTTLCGLSREETEIDFSGQHLGAGDAVLIANDISSDMGDGGIDEPACRKEQHP